MSTSQEFERGAQRLRVEVRRLTDVHHDLRQALAHRVWQGPASERFERSVRRRESEIAEQRDLLDLLARRLEDAAATAARHEATA
ncbi:hypothetical protein Rhe02_65890 [Rhizocola hellebori]|uniref:WXG100 family type VII secretion target n=1 Tax=Rhizocola hellebori TaxID=1392758 RepID=A0A8J3QEG0_9ACTN|nr:hypothetical protein [Rhizocola hellebori]GIH08522.1 hypothetical protein Rhe02_65890 [Rhizocola hellebori]